MSAYKGGDNYGLHAACSFDADAAAAAFRNQRGFAAAFIRNGAGDYSFGLSDGIVRAQAVMVCTLQAAAAGMVSVEWVNANTIRVRTLDSAAAAVDIDFTLCIFDMGPN